VKTPGPGVLAVASQIECFYRRDMKRLNAYGLFALAVLCSPALMLAQVPTVADGGILNGASFAKGQAVAPGSLVSIFGTELAASLAQADSVPLSTVIGGVSVTFNGVAAPLQFVSPTQVNVQVPWEVSPADGGSATVDVVVKRGSSSSAAAKLNLVSAAPAFFTVSGGQAIAINGDGTLAAPSGSIPGLSTHPAKTGDTLVLYATGLGAVTPSVLSGHDSLDQLRRTNQMPVVTIGGMSAQIPFSGLTPQFPGVNQLNVVIPGNVASGSNVPVQIQLNGITHQATVAIQ